MKNFIERFKNLYTDLLNKFHDFKKKEEITYEKEKHLWFMPKTFILDELQTRRYIVLTITLICLFLFISLFWATVTTIDEVAVTYGEIVTVTKVNQIQHLEGGIVQSVYVHEGQEVKKDQLLVDMDGTSFKSELQELQAREVALTTDVHRLESFIKHKNGQPNQPNIDYSKFDNKENNSISIQKVAEGDITQLSLENKSQKNQQQILESQIDQKKEEINKLNKQIEINEKNKVLLSKEFNIYKNLAKKEYISKIEFLAKEREVNQLDSDLANLSFERNKAVDALKEFEFKLNELNTSLEKDAVGNLNKATDDLVQVQYAIKKFQDKVKRSKIYSPIDGFVKGIEVVPGAVVVQNGILMTIVPSHQILEAETRISTLDIGHIKVGDKARVKILAFDYSRYGNIEGAVTEISATTFFDEVNKTPYYKAKISLKEQYVKDKKNKLKAGMTVQADIVTGRKTILQYLMKPIYTNVESSFYER